MAKKRLNIKDKTGLPVDYDISAENVTIDGEGGKPLTQKLDEIAETEAQAVRSITFNGQSYNRDNGIINIGEQEQPNWNESNPNYRTYIRNKPTLLSQFTNDCGFVTSSQIPEGADLSTVFASVAYDQTTSRINFFGKGSNTVLAYLDAAPFIVDGMVENVTLDSSTNELVITFNTASGKSPIRVPLGSISGQGTVQSVKMNGGTPIQPVNGVIDLGTVITEHQSLSSYATKNYVDQAVQQSAGQDGKSAYQVAVDNGFRGSEAEWLASLHGADGVASADDVYVVNNYNGVPADLPQGKVAVLGAGLGTSIGKVFNVNLADANNATPYRLWVGTAEELEALKANDGIEDDVIYLIGTVPTPAVRYNVSKSLTNCTVPSSTPATAKEGAAFSVTVSPASGYTIDTATGTMAGGTLTKTNNQDGSVTFSTQSVTGNITITANASVHLQSITVTQGTRTGNAIQMNAVLNPANAENVSLQWSVSDSQHVTINQSTGLLTIHEGASNESVKVTCTDANSASGAPSGTLQLTGLSYESTPVPITAITDISATRTDANMMQLSATANGNSPDITFAVVNVPKVKKVVSTIQNEGTENEVIDSYIDTEDAVTLNGSTLTYKGDCTVRIRATAGDVTYEKDIQIAHDTNDVLYFEDWKAKAMMMYLTDSNVPMRPTKANVDSYSFTYGTAASSVYAHLGTNDSIYKNGARAIDLFNESKWFTAYQKDKFSGFTKLKELSLCEGITDLPSGSITSCGKLKKISFPSTLGEGENKGYHKNNSGGSIQSCSSLQILDFRGSSITDIQDDGSYYILNGCSAFKTIFFPEGMKTVGKQSANVVSSRVTIQQMCFAGSAIEEMKVGEAIKRLVFKSETVPTVSIILDNNKTVGNTGIKIYVPDNNFDAYKAAAQFSAWDNAGKLLKISELPDNWDKTTFAVTTDSTVTNNNTDPVVEYGSSYTATIAATTTSLRLSVTMDGEDVTSKFLNNGVLHIPYIVGEIIISTTTNQGEQS